MKEKEKENTEQQLYIGAFFFFNKIRLADSHVSHFSLKLIYVFNSSLAFFKTIILKENNAIPIFIILYHSIKEGRKNACSFF